MPLPAVQRLLGVRVGILASVRRRNTPFPVHSCSTARSCHHSDIALMLTAANITMQALNSRLSGRHRAHTYLACYAFVSDAFSRSRPPFKPACMSPSWEPGHGASGRSTALQAAPLQPQHKGAPTAATMHPHRPLKRATRSPISVSTGRTTADALPGRSGRHCSSSAGLLATDAGRAHLLLLADCSQCLLPSTAACRRYRRLLCDACCACRLQPG